MIQQDRQNFSGTFYHYINNKAHFKLNQTNQLDEIFSAENDDYSNLLKQGFCRCDLQVSDKNYISNTQFKQNNKKR